MTCISHRHRFAYVHIYKAGGTAVNELLLVHARLRERVARHPVGRKIFYAVNIAQEKACRGRLPKGTSSWYMGLEKHAPLSEVVAYLGPSRRDYRLFSVIREPLSWVESQYNYISMRPLHAQHKAVSAMSLADYAEDFIARGRGLQSHMLRPAPLPGGGSRAIDAVFTLESLAADTGPLRSFLGLPEAEDGALPRRNQSSARGTRDALPASLRAELAHYLAPDIALHDAAVAAGGALLAIPSRPVPVAGT
ncbi:hypothetical protein [Roseinatronobacter sp.]|uniref:hypothetical protein n=1 Tax=Roseinatronobacter sp. TaxID=1945755 RepID=UPI0025CE3DE2|nr:hypothetical protein [Roseibaca sp.]